MNTSAIDLQHIVRNAGDASTVDGIEAITGRTHIIAVAFGTVLLRLTCYFDASEDGLALRVVGGSHLPTGRTELADAAIPIEDAVWVYVHTPTIFVCFSSSTVDYVTLGDEIALIIFQFVSIETILACAVESDEVSAVFHLPHTAVSYKILVILAGGCNLVAGLTAVVVVGDFVAGFA